MKRCQACTARTHLADFHCQRCGVAIAPPPPAWVRVLAVVYWVVVTLMGASHLIRAVRYALTTDAGRYVMAHYPDIVGFLFAAVVAPLFAIYAILRATTEATDYLDLEVRSWRAERFRKHGW